MVMFWVLTVVMILLSLWFIVPPLISKKGTESIKSEELNIAIYRQKLAELDTNEENLSEDQLKQAREELEQGLLQDVAQRPQAAAAIKTLTPRIQYQVAALVGVLVPVVALLLYAKLSPQQWTELVQYDPSTATKARTEMSSMDNMVTKLEEKLKQNPTDPKGWTLLGRSYFVMGRYQEAANSYGQANELSGGKNVDLLTDQAEALAMANEGNLLGEPTQLIKQVLALKSDHPKSLWLAGNAFYQGKQYKEAVFYWETLYNMHKDKSGEGAQVLQQRIAEARALLGEKSAAPTSPKKTSAAKGNTEIKVSVNLDSKLKARAAPGDTVFIFARAVQGPALPLAIVKKQVKDLPVTVNLNDSMSMVPNMTMSSFPQIYVGARISKSGNANPQSGDLQGRSSPIDTGKPQQVKISISQEVL